MTFTRSAAVMSLAFSLCSCGDVDRARQPHGGTVAHQHAGAATTPANLHVDRSGPSWIATDPSLEFITVFEHNNVVVRGGDRDGAWSLPLSRARIDCDQGSDGPPTRRDDDPLAGTRRSAGNDDVVWYSHAGDDGGDRFHSWYVQTARGLEQGFTVPAEPRCVADAGMLTVRVSVGPEMVAVASPTQDRVILRTPEGKSVASYGEVSALDAAGRALSASLDVEPGAILVRVDARDAAYPIEIDPLLSAFVTQLVPSPFVEGWELGSAVAVSGDVAVMGHPGALHPTNSNLAWFGAVYVFRRANGAWQQEATLRPDDDTVSMEFGASVAVDGSSLFVGAPTDRSLLNRAGVVYVFAYEGGGWQKKSKLYASDAYADGGFGASLALQSGRLLIGTDPGSGEGPCGAYVFDRTGSTWKQTKKLGLQANSADEACAVALDGDTAVVGVQGLSTAGYTGAGAAYVFTRGAGSWTQSQKLTASDPAHDDAFGASVAVRGELIVAGAPEKDGAAGYSQGAMYAFARSGTSWTQSKKLLADSPVANDEFGRAVAFGGQNLLVGSNRMKVSVYWPTNGDWTLRGLLTRTYGTFGHAMAMSGSTLLVGEGGFVYQLRREQGDPCTTAEECKTGFCADGLCCDVACEAPGIADCLVCSKAAGGANDGVCGVAKTGTGCRVADGACDEPETCDGTAQVCPDDRISPAGKVCRTAVGECDHEEACKGISKSCPTDLKLPDGQVCREARGVCDLADTCDGKSAVCVDNAVEAGLVCRASVAACDEEEQCNGSDGMCPPDAPKRVGTPCREAAGDCDRAEACDGWSTECAADELQPAGFVCRFPASWCDEQEACDGVQPACPDDAIKPNGAGCPSGSCTDGLCYAAGLPAPAEEESSCGCRAVGAQGSNAWWTVALLALLARRGRGGR